MDSHRSSSAASSSHHTQMPDLKKRALPTNSFALKTFPFISLLQRQIVPYRIWTYLLAFYAVFQHLIVPLFANHFPDSKTDFYVTSICMLCPNTYGKTWKLMSGIVLTVGYLSIFFFLLLICIYKYSNTLPSWAISLMSIIMHLIIPLIFLPIASIAGSALEFLLNLTYDKKVTTPIFVLSLILWIIFIGFFYTITLFSSHTVFYHDSVGTYFDGQSIFFSYTFNSIILFVAWISKDLNKDFPYFLGAIQIVLNAFLMYHVFQFPFTYIFLNAEFGATLIGSTFAVIGYFSSKSYVPLRYILAVVSWLIADGVLYFVMKFYAKKLIMRTEFSNNKSAIIQFRLAVATFDNSFLTGKVIDMITQGTNDYTVRLEIAKFICFFQEFQPQFTAQLAMLRNSNGLSLGESFLFYQLRIVETGRQPLCAVDELIPLRDETKRIEMKIRAAWKYIQNNHDFFAPSIMEPITRQVTACDYQWQDALNKYPRNALLAEEYAHFLVECKCDFEQAAQWHFQALQLQDGKIFKYDAACLNFLHIYPEYAPKIINKTIISTMDDLDVKAKEDSLGQLVEHPRLRLEFQRAISGHITIALPILACMSMLKCLAFLVLWIYLISTFLGTFNQSVDRMTLIKNSTDVGENTALSMISFALYFANQSDELPTIQEMAEVIGQDRVSESGYVINPFYSYLLNAYEFIQNGTNSLVDVYNGMIAAIIDGDVITNSVNTLFKTNYTITYANSSYANVNGGNESLAFIFSNFFMSAHTLTLNSNFSMFDTTAFDTFNLASLIVDNINTFAITFVEEEGYEPGHFKTSTFIIIAIVYAAVFITSDLILIFVLNFRMMKTLFACKKFSEETFNEISSNIFIAQISTDAPNMSASISKTEKSNIKGVLLFIIETILTLLMLLGIVIFILAMRRTSRDFINMSDTLLYAAVRKSKAIESTYSLIIANSLSRIATLLGGNSFRRFAMNYIARARSSLQTMMTAHQHCATGFYGRRGLIDTINSIRTDSPCNFSLSNSTYHESLACLSLDSGVSAFYNLMTGLIVQAESTSFFTDDDFIQTFHYINSHLYYQMEEIVDDLLYQGKEEGEISDAFVTALAVICIFITIVEFLISAYRNVFLFRTYRTLINFLLRTNPNDAVANDDLMMILLNRKISQRMAKMSETATLLANTTHPLIFTTNDGVIVYVNSSFQIVFNYEVSHIVGQNISLITDADKLEKIYHQDKTIKETVVKDDATEDEGFNKHETVVFDHINLRMKRENGQEIECDILPIMTGTKTNKSFAFVVTDLSSITAKQKKINILKGANDTLQTNMLPKVLLQNEGKTKVGKATVCTIRLVQFSNSLAPAAVMKQRKSILVKLDECLKKYEVLERLFFAQGMYSIISRDPDATTHVFRFIDDVLASFDDPTFFGEITIGVDTNGVIDLKVTDKYVKEIVSVGQTFENSARLSLIGESGKACVTEAVYNQVANIGAKFVSKKDTIIGDYYSVEPLER